MLKPKRLANGNLVVPVSVKGKDGTIADTMQEVKPNSKLYKEWLPFLQKGNPPR